MNSASQARETPLESFKTASKDMKRERDDEQHLVEQYFSDVRKKPLLTREQEIALAKKKDEGYQARKELITGSFLTREQGNALAKKIDAGDEARKELTEHNLRFVISKARKFTGCGLPLPDLIQEGNIALIEAVNSYEWEKGRLTTYASRNIEWKINRAIAEQSGIIRIPEYEQRELHKFERAKEKLSEGARDLSDLEIGNKIGIKQDKVEDLTALSKRTIISLTLSRREEDNNTVLQDTIPSKNPDVEEVVYSQEQNRLLMAIPLPITKS